MKIFKLFLVFCFSFLFLSYFCEAKDTDYAYLNFEHLNFKASHFLLYNLDDEKVVYQKGSDEKISIASLTKIMTAMVALLHYEDLDQPVKIPNEAFYNTSGYAMAGFKRNETVTIRDLLYGTLLPSGVEAAQALAVLTAGSIDNFVQMMNDLKEKIGMPSTHFSNPVGRDDIANYSTLEDVQKLLLYALHHEVFKEIYTTRFYETTNHLKLYSTLVAPSEKYFLDVTNIEGSKSGFTKEAGLCLSSLAEYNGIHYLLIVARSPYQNGFPNHIVDSLEIYNYFNDHYAYQNLFSVEEPIVTLTVQDGEILEYPIYVEQNIPLYLDKEAIFDYHYEGINVLNRKIKKNDYLGKIHVYYHQQLLYSQDVYLKETLKYRYTDYKIIGLFLTFVFLVFLILKFRKKSKKKK